MRTTDTKIEVIFMTTEEYFELGTTRSKFDFDLCSVNKGWAQVDTKSDASYYGIWANPTELKILSYMEGDIILNIAENSNEFIEKLRNISEWHRNNDEFKGIDCGCSNSIEQAFISLGLFDLFHPYDQQLIEKRAISIK